MKAAFNFHRPFHRHRPVSAALYLALLAAAPACTAGTPAAQPPPATTATTATSPGASIPSASGGVLATDTPLLPRAITSFGAAGHDGTLYVLGGYHGQPHQYSREGQTGALYKHEVQLGQAGDQSWQELPGVPPLQSVALVIHDGALIRVGGMRAHNSTGESARLESLTEVARYDRQTRTWTALPPLPRGRSSHDAVVVGDALYVIGGWNMTEDGSERIWHDTALRMDLSAAQPAWETFAVPFERRALASATDGRRIIAVGGMSADGEPSPQVDIYDTQTRTWTRGPDYPGSPFGIAATGMGDAVYASGADGVVYRLRAAEGAWQAVATLMFPRFFHRMVATGDGSLLVLGGIMEMQAATRVRHVERVEVGAGENQRRIASWTLAAPGPARNRQGIFLRDSTLYVFGGNNSLEQHDFEPENFLAEAHKLQLTSLTWEPMAAFPVPRQTMQTAFGPDSTTGIVVGGFGHDGEVARTHTESYVYDFDSDRWQQRAAGLPQPRSQFGLVRHDGALWVFGGLDYDPRRAEGDQFKHVRSILRAELDGDDAPFTDTGVELPRTRRAFGATTLGDRYYLVGGMTDNFQFVDTCDVFDFETRQWSTIPSPRKTRISPELIALDGKLYLAGGSSRGADGDLEPDRSIEVFDPETRTWSVAVDDLGFDTKHSRIMAFHHRLLVYSAHNEDNIVRLMLVDPTP